LGGGPGQGLEILNFLGIKPNFACMN
jgi:hypothetical protein